MITYVKFEGTAKVNLSNAENNKSKSERLVIEALNEAMCYGCEDGVNLMEATATFIKAVDDFDIMNTTNGHNKRLVAYINQAWEIEDYRDQMKRIINLLMMRDFDECNEKGVNNDVHEYLMRVADDTDLECILKYVRW